VIGDEVIQAGLIARLKTYPSPTGAFTNSTEIRELGWQGDEFVYPNIRLDLEDNRYYFDEQKRCQLQEVEWSIYVFSEQRSSKQSSQIKTEIINFLVGNGWTSLAHNIRFTSPRLIENVPAVRESERVWRCQARFSSRVSPY
jgi:hypothetical protein